MPATLPLQAYDFTIQRLELFIYQGVAPNEIVPNSAHRHEGDIGRSPVVDQQPAGVQNSFGSGRAC
jgi:hypothetical protein